MKMAGGLSSPDTEGRAAWFSAVATKEARGWVLLLESPQRLGGGEAEWILLAVKGMWPGQGEQREGVRLPASHSWAGFTAWASPADLVAKVKMAIPGEVICMRSDPCWAHVEGSGSVCCPCSLTFCSFLSSQVYCRLH